LRDAPTRIGRFEHGQVVERGQQFEAVRGVLGEPEAGSTTIRSRDTPEATAISSSAAARDHLGDERRVDGLAVHLADRPRVCISTSAARRSATAAPMPESYRRPLISFTITAPSSSAARATSAL